MACCFAGGLPAVRALALSPEIHRGVIFLRNSSANVVGALQERMPSSHGVGTFARSTMSLALSLTFSSKANPSIHFIDSHENINSSFEI